MKPTQRFNAFDLINYTFMIGLIFITLYPIWYTVILSFNDGTDAMQGGVYWWPRVFSLQNYEAVFSNNGIMQSFFISVLRTLAGTLTHVFFTAMTAYALTKKSMPGRNIMFGLYTFTMFFGGGLIPYYLLIRDLGLLDNFLVYIIPALFSFFHAIIFMSFFRELPVSLEESASLEGANDFTIFIRLILPLSTPVLATIALFVGVGHWNDYFTAVIYIESDWLRPISTFLYKIVAESSGTNTARGFAPPGMSTSTVTSNSVKLATMVIATFPVVVVYPFLQRYFVKGMLIGGVKG